MSAKTRLRDNKSMITSVVYHGILKGIRRDYERFAVYYSNGKYDFHEITEEHPDYKWLKENSVDYAVIKEQRKQEKIAAKTPIKTRILDGGRSSTTTKSSGVGRAIVGGVLFGATGAVVGATTSGRKTISTNYTMFKVWYKDGHDEVEKVEHGTMKYKEYLELLED